MEYALRVSAGHELMKNSNINLLDEVEELRAQINLLKLGVNPHDLSRNDPEINYTTPLSMPIPILNQPYQNQPQQSSSNNRNQNNNQNRNQNHNQNRNNNWNNNNRNRNNRNRNVNCFICGQLGHGFRNCNNGQRIQQFFNQGNNQNNDNNNNQNRSNNPFEVNNLMVNGLSTPPIKAYDIVPDVWNQPAKVTIGELLENQQYRQDLQTALNTMDNREINVLDTTALYMNVKINGEFRKAIPDSGAATSVIDQATVTKLGLIMTSYQGENLQALESGIRVIGEVLQPQIQIGQANISIPLKVVSVQTPTFLLGMDWFKKFQAKLDVHQKTLEFQAQGRRYQTKVEFEKGNQINYIRFFGSVFLTSEEDENGISDEVIEVGLEESLRSDYAEGLSAQVLTLEPLAEEIKGQ